MTKSSLLIDIKFDISRTYEDLWEKFPTVKIIDWNKDKSVELSGVKYALVWNPDADLYEKLPDLEVIFSAGAGVDHVLSHPKLPDIPIVRFVDPTLTTRMGEWVSLQCLSHLRQTRIYDAQQRNCEWIEHDQPEAKDIRVGIMGLGVLGQDCAHKLNTLGFQVSGWSRTKKNMGDVVSYGGDELDLFLAKTDFLVGLLPLTDNTRHIYNRSLFEKLAKDSALGPIFINGGRGGSQVGTDIVSCIEDGTLKGASLDVFESEPLDSESPLWAFENVIITPHAAAVSDKLALARHVANQIERYEAGDGLLHVVNRKQGY